MGALQRSRESGFTLVETLISVALFAFGMLALAAFQLATLRVNLDTRAQTQTTLMATDILGMIQSDPQNPLIYDGVDTRNPASWPASSARAAANVQRWAIDLGTVLPQAWGTVQVDAQQIHIRVTGPGRSGEIGTTLNAPVP